MTVKLFENQIDLKILNFIFINNKANRIFKFVLEKDQHIQNVKGHFRQTSGPGDYEYLKEKEGITSSQN